MSDFPELEKRTREALQHHDLKPNDWLIAGTLVDLTFARGRERVMIADRNTLHYLTGIHRSEISHVLDRLEESGIIGRADAPEFLTRNFQDPYWVWVLPHPSDWRRVQPRCDREFRAQLMREIDEMNTPGFVRRQKLLGGGALTPPKMPGLSAEIAKNSREAALTRDNTLGCDEPAGNPGDAARRGNAHESVGESRHPAQPKNLADSGSPGPARESPALIQTIRTSTGIPSTSGSDVDGKTVDVGMSTGKPSTSDAGYSRARARTREHVHVHEHGTEHDHVHEHAPYGGDEEEESGPWKDGGPALKLRKLCDLETLLDADQERYLDMLPDVSGRGHSYRKTWACRLIEHRRTAMATLDETRVAKREGRRFTAGPGQFANDLFKRLLFTAHKH